MRVGFLDYSELFGTFEVRHHRVFRQGGSRYVATLLGALFVLTAAAPSQAQQTQAGACQSAYAATVKNCNDMAASGATPQTCNQAYAQYQPGTLCGNYGPYPGLPAASAPNCSGSYCVVGHNDPPPPISPRCDSKYSIAQLSAMGCFRQGNSNTGN